MGRAKTGRDEPGAKSVEKVRIGRISRVEDHRNICFQLKITYYNKQSIMIYFVNLLPNYFATNKIATR
jgi:hypothetical protein